MTEASVLARPDFSKVFTIHADASQYAIGSVLTQEDDNGEEHPIVYISRVLTPAESNYSTTVREKLAILYAIRKMRCYVEGYYFIIKTDHIALEYIQSIKKQQADWPDEYWNCKNTTSKFIIKKVRYKW